MTMDRDGLVSWKPRQIVYVRDVPVLVPGRTPNVHVEFDSLSPSERSRLEWLGLEGWLLKEEPFVMATTPFVFACDADGREVVA